MARHPPACPARRAPNCAIVQRPGQRFAAIAGSGGGRRWPLALSLFTTFLFQAGNMAVYAYVIGLGEAAGLEMDLISPALAWAAWIGIVGSGR